MRSGLIESQPKIAVVIATRDRAALLADRALPSVMAQTRIPDYLVVVDDSSVELRLGNSNIVASVNLPDVLVRYLENERTAGASGSWNTAVYFLYRQVDDPADLFVAILDDDYPAVEERIDDEAAEAVGDRGDDRRTRGRAVGERGDRDCAGHERTLDGTDESDRSGLAGGLARSAGAARAAGADVGVGAGRPRAGITRGGSKNRR